MKKSCILLILLSIWIYPIVEAKNNFESVVIGTVEVGKEVFIYNQKSYPLYQVKGQLYVPISNLQQMSVRLENKDGILYLDLDLEKQEEIEVVSIPIEGETAMMSKLPVYCGNMRSYALMVKEEVLIPLNALKALWNIKYDEGAYWQASYLQNELQLVEIDEQGIENLTDHLMPIKCIHLYWNGKDYERIEEYLLLEANERKSWIINVDKQYITTVISEINELPVLELDDTYYGQSHLSTFRQYSQSIRLNQLERLFPQQVILAQMKYNIGPFKEKDIVELCRSEKHAYFWVKDETGHKYQVPYGSVRIIGEKGATLNKVTSDDIAEFATLSQIESPTDFLLWTDLYRQRTYVLRKEGAQWQFEKSFICSTGKNNNPTPTGFYEVQYMIPYIGVDKGYRCKYALVFFRDYMYHSILFDKSGQYVKSGQYELGSKASHGCVRLSEKDSAWLYKHIPVKTMVWIR